MASWQNPTFWRQDLGIGLLYLTFWDPEKRCKPLGLIGGLAS
jgi:hypothetical protein